MKSRNILAAPLLFTILLISTDIACADPLTAAYSVSLSVQTTIVGLRDGAGNPLTSLPSDLSIVGRTIDVTGSGFFASIYSPNRPADITESSFSGSGDLIVRGSPQGDGPLPIGIGDGHILNSAVSGAVRNLLSNPVLIFSSDVSQFGAVEFTNRSPSTTYFADIVLAWTFDLRVENTTLPTSNIFVDAQYVLSLAVCCGPDFFLEIGFPGPLGPGTVRQDVGSGSFSTVFEIPPGGTSGLATRTFAGGRTSNTPEPSTLTLLGLGLAMGVRLARRHRGLFKRKQTRHRS